MTTSTKEKEQYWHCPYCNKQYKGQIQICPRCRREMMRISKERLGKDNLLTIFG